MNRWNNIKLKCYTTRVYIAISRLYTCEVSTGKKYKKEITESGDNILLTKASQGFTT